MALPGEPTPGTPLPDVMETPGVVFVIDGSHELDAVVKALGGEVPERDAPAEGEPAQA